MNGSIYIIKNNKNDKVYIGQTIQSVDVRFKQHLRLNKSNSQQAIYKAIKSIGKQYFFCETLESDISTYEKLNELEEYYIAKYNSLVPNGYNLCPGGQKWRRKHKLLKEEENEVCELYKQGNSVRTIGEFYNVNHHTVLDVLHQNNIVMRSKSEKLPDRSSIVKEDVLRVLYCDKKMRVKDIAKELNVQDYTIRRALKRYNLKEYNIG